MSGSVTPRSRRAAAFAAVGTLALIAPLLGPLATVPFIVVAIVAVRASADGRLFELFARPGDRQEGTLYGLAGFSLAAAGLAILAGLDAFGMPYVAFVGAVLVVSYGNVGEAIARERIGSEMAAVNGFVGGAIGATVPGVLLLDILGAEPIALPVVAFLVASAALLAALLRSVLYSQDDPLVMCSTGLLLWLLAAVSPALTASWVVLGLGITAALGYAAYALDTASIPGTLTGTLLALLTIVLGGVGWFAVLVAFFGIGGLSTKFRYDAKVERGVAEDNEGARGSANVLANSAVALGSVLGFAAAPEIIPIEPTLFLYAFAGSLAAALGDTLSSEIGGVFDDPVLITTLEPVEPGTDGAITVQGTAAGLVGTAIVAGLSIALFASVDTVGALVVVVAGFSGMTVDSLLGATVEGRVLGNGSVNFLATFAGGVVGAVAALGVGLVTLV